MGNDRAALVLPVVLALAVGCAGDPPAARIDALVLEAPPGLPRRPDALRLTVTRFADDGTEQPVLSAETVPELADGALRPWATPTTPQAPGDPGHTLYRYRAAALLDGREYVATQHRLVFLPGVLLTLPMRLFATCADHPCSDGLTCVEGACVEDFVPACSLLDDPRSPACAGDAGVDPIVRLRAGELAACALRGAGRLHCWGYLFFATERLAREMPSPEPVTRIAVGGATACGVLRSGAVACWGAPTLGVADYPQPERIAGLPAVRDVGVLGELSADGTGILPVACALTPSGEVWCWGAGRLPARLTGLPAGVVELAAGSEELCVRTASGAVHCGAPRDGALDAVPARTDAREVSVGGGGRCVLTTAGGLECVAADPTTEPVARSESAGFDAVAIGTQHACARRVGGEVLCWGLGAFGQLGDGGTTSRASPDAATVSGLVAPLQLEAGQDFTCALTRAGGVVCWGSNVNGTVGDGGVDDVTSPIAVAL